MTWRRTVNRPMGRDVLCSTLWGKWFSRRWSWMTRKKRHIFRPNVTQIGALNTAGSHWVKNLFSFQSLCHLLWLHEARCICQWWAANWSSAPPFRPSSWLLVPWRCCPLLQLPEPGDTGGNIRSRYFLQCWNTFSPSHTGLYSPTMASEDINDAFYKHSYVISEMTVGDHH